MKYLDYILELLRNIKSTTSFNKDIVKSLIGNGEELKTMENGLEMLNSLENLLEMDTKRKNYQNYFHEMLKTIDSEFPFINDDSIENYIEGSDKRIESNIKLIKDRHRVLKNSFNRLMFFLEFFEQIGYFENNIVITGANGTGKTTLAGKINEVLGRSGLIISAQRLLIIPKIDSISDSSRVFDSLSDLQKMDKSNKTENDYNTLRNEFKIIVETMITAQANAASAYRAKASTQTEQRQPITPPSPTLLEKALDIWNSLISERTIVYDGSLNLNAQSSNGKSYPLMQMSDGEKVLFYLICHVFLAPTDGFIVIDEPEMYLHKSIVERLWDILEQEREDCIFIYLTHDLDFATSRTSANKVWIKEFEYPNQWDIKTLDPAEIPENLLLKLVGSKRNILFCEGTKNSIDYSVYSILFPELLISPVGSCLEVISHTKAYNKISGINNKAFGLIDSDYHDDERLEKLINDSIYSFNVAEIENLFLDLDFLNILASKIPGTEFDGDKITEEVINKLNEDKELQSANYVSSKINYYFKESHISRSNLLGDIETNFNNFIRDIDYNKWYNDRLLFLETIAKDNDYEKAIRFYNNKGLKRIIANHLKIMDFTNRCIALLKQDRDAREILYDYFPNELNEAGVQD